MGKDKRSTKFPCECGRTLLSAEEFSNHVHFDCKLGTIGTPSEDWMKEHPEFAAKV